MKKKVLLLAICFLILTPNAFAELTQSDLEEIDKLIQASETRIKEYVDLKIDALDAKLTGQIKALDERVTGQIKALDGRLTQVYGFVIALVALIAVAVGLPQILVARQGKEMRTQDQRIEALQQEIEKLKQERGSRPKM
ncbi:hypothetical protein J5I95_06505 [Candidatus Poribacteria bacterium]|nr:hypothetical protein [Candidatus Poribacteria bacterium]